MSASWAGRAARVSGWVYFACVLLCVRVASGCPGADEIRAAPDVPQSGRAPVWLEQPGAPPMLVYPPARSTGSRAELLVLLHGMCGHPENECAWFAGSATRGRFVVCPRADLECAGGGHVWSGSSKIRNELVGEFRRRTECTFGDRVSADGATLAGFSLGSFVALDVAEHASRGQWPNVLLVAARVSPSPLRLERAGVGGILLASGDWDLSRPSMLNSARWLSRSGLRARYTGLGPIGHWFARDPHEMDAWLVEALGWFDGT